MRNTAPPDDLIPIDQAAQLLGRSVKQVRVYAARGFTSSGTNLPVYRDALTKIRWFSRADVLRARAAMFGNGDSRMVRARQFQG